MVSRGLEGAHYKGKEVFKFITFSHQDVFFLTHKILPLFDFHYLFQGPNFSVEIKPYINIILILNIIIHIKKIKFILSYARDKLKL